MTFFNKNYLYSLLLLFLTAIPYVLAVQFNSIFVDSGYYLKLVEHLSEGLVLYKDFHTSYTPVYFYLLYFVKSIFSIGINYEFFLGVQFIITYLTGYFLYRIGVILLEDKKLSFLSVLLFLVTIHWLDGNSVLLEIPSMLFGFIALYLALQHKNTFVYAMLIGVFSALSYLTKQYAIGFFLLGLYVLILRNKTPIKQIVVTVMSFSFPLLFFYWSKMSSLITVEVVMKYGYEEPILERFMKIVDASIFLLTRIFPVLLLIIPLFLYKWFRHQLVNKLWIYGFLILPIIAFQVQFYFWYSLHYYLYIVPFVCLLILFFYKEVSGIMRYIYLFFVGITVLLQLYSTFHNRVYKEYLSSQSTKKNQYELAEMIKNNVPKGSVLYVADMNLIEQYYLTGMRDPTLSYSFASGLSEEEHIERILLANYVLKSTYTTSVKSTTADSLLSTYIPHYIYEGVILYSKK